MNANNTTDQQYYNSNNNQMLNWQFVPNNDRSQVNYVNNMGQTFMNEPNMISLDGQRQQQQPQQMQQQMQHQQPQQMQQQMQPQQQQPQQAQASGTMIDPLESSLNMMYSWNPNVQIPPMIKEEWSMNTNSNNSTHIPNQQPHQILSYSPQQQQFSLPPTPPVSTSTGFPSNSINNIINNSINMNMPRSNFNEMPRSRPSVSYGNSSNQMSYNDIFPQQQQQSYSPEITPSSSSTGSNSPISTPPPLNYFLPPKQQPTFMMQPPPPPRPSHHPTPKKNNRRKSTGSGTTRTYRRRASSHPSVASVVSLSAHEPVARVIDGIEYITFLYSHDRLVKEYTVRTDVASVNLNDIPLDFRVQNAIYPRANVSKEEYDGNRWEYETSCNRLGWELCWLNQEELCGRRGLIQRAVDSYRNRHAEMRSRRVTRQEKVANGTLRKRRAKKAISAIL